MVLLQDERNIFYARLCKNGDKWFVLCKSRFFFAVSHSSCHVHSIFTWTCTLFADSLFLLINMEPILKWKSLLVKRVNSIRSAWWVVKYVHLLQPVNWAIGAKILRTQFMKDKMFVYCLAVESTIYHHKEIMEQSLTHIHKVSTYLECFQPGSDPEIAKRSFFFCR